MEIVLVIFFLSLFKINIQFVEREIILKKYITKDALHTTQKVKLINKKICDNNSKLRQSDFC